MVTYLIRVFVGIYMLRLLVIGLGVDNYGLFVLYVSLTSFYALFDFGISNSLLKSTIYLNRKNPNQLRLQIILSFFPKKATMSSIGAQCVASVLIYNFYPYLYQKVPSLSELDSLIGYAIVVAIIVTLQGWVTQILTGIQELNFIYISTCFYALIKLLIILLINSNILHIVYSFTVIEIFILISNICWLVHVLNKKQKLRNSNIQFSKEDLVMQNQTDFFKLSTFGWFSNHFLRALFPIIMPTATLARFDLISKPFFILKPMFASIFNIFISRAAFHKGQDTQLKFAQKIISALSLLGLLVQHSLVQSTLEAFFAIEFVGSELNSLHIISVACLLLFMNGCQHRLYLITQPQIGSLVKLDVINLLVILFLISIYHLNENILILSLIFFSQQISLSIFLKLKSTHVSHVHDFVVLVLAFSGLYYML